MTDGPERIARSLRTVPPYKHALEIMADDLTQWLRDEGVHDGDIFEHSIILGQGDYPTGRLIIESTVRKMNEAATALDAAEARIADLEDTLNIERALSDGAHRRAKAAHAEALEEAAKVADGVGDVSADLAIVGLPENARGREAMNAAACKIAAAIRALKEKPNG